jgi:hypothetical protein
MGAHRTPTQHVPYWACPECGSRFLIDGDKVAEQIPLVVDLLHIEPAEIGEVLFDFVPRSWLEEAEAAVETHESLHLPTRVVA